MNKQTMYQVASEALAERRSMPIEELLRLVGTSERTTVAGPEGETYFVEIGFGRLIGGSGVRVTAVVDHGNSHKLERIEESIEIAAE